MQWNSSLTETHRGLLCYFHFIGDKIQDTVWRSEQSAGMQFWAFRNWASLLCLGFAFFFYFNPYSSPHSPISEQSIYDFTVKDIRKNDVSLSKYRGKVLLIVNVASHCGLTETNYRELNALYEKYKDQGFEILAFPCNQFGKQEPGTNEQIEEAVCTKFKAEFPIFDKIAVNGKEASPLYKFLKHKKKGIFGDGIKWNFTKFLINKEGEVVGRYAPTTAPMMIEKTIQSLLNS